MDNITSAEMTAVWRSTEPLLSCDNYSVMLASSEGKKKALDFQNHIYPLVSRHLSVRAGYIHRLANDIIKNRNIETCVSLGSGFSSLLHTLVQKEPKLVAIDTDLATVLSTRTQRLKKLNGLVDNSVLQKVKMAVVDVEEFAKQRADLAKYLGLNNRTLIMMEGLSYYLSPSAIRWVFAQCVKGPAEVLLFDYWPTAALSKSRVLRAVIKELNADCAETVTSTIDQYALKDLVAPLSLESDVSLQEAEGYISKNRQLVNLNEFVPARIAVVCR